MFAPVVTDWSSGCRVILTVRKKRSHRFNFNTVKASQKNLFPQLRHGEPLQCSFHNQNVICKSFKLYYLLSIKPNLQSWQGLGEILYKNWLVQIKVNINLDTINCLFFK